MPSSMIGAAIDVHRLLGQGLLHRVQRHEPSARHQARRSHAQTFGALGALAVGPCEAEQRPNRKHLPHSLAPPKQLLYPIEMTDRYFIMQYLFGRFSETVCRA